MTVHDAHVVTAWIVIVSNALAGLWALGAHWLPVLVFVVLPSGLILRYFMRRAKRMRGSTCPARSVGRR